MQQDIQTDNQQNNDIDSQSKIIKALSERLVLCIGIVFCLLYFIPLPEALKEYKILQQNVALSVGCSLIATYIAGYYTSKNERQTFIEQRLNNVETIANSIDCHNSEMVAQLKKITDQTNELLNKNDKRILDILQELGINSERYYRQNIKHTFPVYKNKDQVEESVRKSLEEHRISKKFTVGKLNPVELDYYYDLIGGTCYSRNAEYFAKMLSSFWNAILEDRAILQNPKFDFVVTPKGGSPILGYEFAKLIKRPFVLHEEKERLTSGESDIREYFNFYTTPLKGSTALIVDDSTTGGRMVSDTVEHLRANGYLVNTCLVVFAPQTKNAAERLRCLDVQLISIIKTHEKHGEKQNG